MPPTRFHLRAFAWAAALGISPLAAHAVAITGENIVLTEASEVSITFEGYSASYTSDLFLDTPANALGLLFTNKTTAIGTTLTLGTFGAGTELIFRLFVHETERTFLSGQADRNTDNVAHTSSETIDSKLWVGFEDLFGGGDKDYNDFRFSISTRPVMVPSTAVPDGTSTSVLLALGWGLVAFASRRLR